MHVLIVVSHPDPKSLTHAIAAEIAAGIVQASPETSVEMADLAAEGFDPRFTAADLAAYRREAPLPPDVVVEHERLGRADALVLAYPVYWWSMPGLLKGWIDRVFTSGWAYEEGAGGRLEKKLRHLPVHLAAIGGADLRTYARHGYFGAMKTQIDHGIFDYCGAPVVSSELLAGTNGKDVSDLFEAARAMGPRIVAHHLRKRAA